MGEINIIPVQEFWPAKNGRGLCARGEGGVLAGFYGISLSDRSLERLVSQNFICFVIYLSPVLSLPLVRIIILSSQTSENEDKDLYYLCRLILL